MAEGALTSVISGVTEVFTAAIGWTGQIFEVVTSNPVPFIMVVGAPVAMLGFAAVRRLIRI